MLGREYRILIKQTPVQSRIEIENQGYLDEVVIDDWFHLEMMNDNSYWIRIGDAAVTVVKNTDGTVSVNIERDQ